MNFNQKEIERYSRHFVLPEFGEAGQAKLKHASVIVIGAGGLGCPVLQYLTAAGIGKIGILDNDFVSLSNLQRQVLYNSEDVGKPKAEQAAKHLHHLNDLVALIPHQILIKSHNALEVLEPYDVIIDCTDNFPTRYLLNDACVILNKPLVYGSVFRYEGQVAVFNLSNSANYRDLYPIPPTPGSVPNCEEGGVLGMLPGVIGCIQANEVVKILTGIGEPLINKLMVIDTLNMETQLINYPNKSQKISIERLIDYDEFCGINKNRNVMREKEITVEELKRLKDNNEDFQLIDIREEYELRICNIGGDYIPMNTIPHSIEKIRRDKKVIIYCRSGARSGNLIKWLEQNHDFDNLYNLKGGILAWANAIDPTMNKY